MKPSQRNQQIITSNKYIINKRENVSPVNNNQNKEKTKSMKPSISSINCTIQKNGIHITPIKRNNSNTKITITHSNIPNISKALEESKNNINKRKYIVTIIDRRQNFLENKNNLQLKHPSFSKVSQIQEKIENKSRDKSFDLGQSHSQTKINININKYNTKIINKYKINKIPISHVFNNIDYTRKNSDRRNIYNPINNNNQNDQERLSTEPKNNVAMYISGSSNKYSDSINKNNEMPKRQIPIQHNRIYSMKTGSREDLNIIENNLLRNNYQKPNEKKNEQKSFYNNYITFTSKYNDKNNINTEENKLRKSFDNSNLTNDKSSLVYNNNNRNNYIY